MRSTVAACVVGLVLGGCSGDGRETDDVDSRASDDTCALLSLEEASRIVGVRYVEQTRNEGRGSDVCVYQQAIVTAPFHFSIMWRDAGLDQVVAELWANGEAEEVEHIDVAGADEALVVRTKGSDLPIQRVAAEVDGRVLLLSYGGSASVAAQLIAAALGEDVPDNPDEPVPDACGLDPAEVEAAIGAPAVPSPNAHEPAWSSCEWKSGAGASFTLRIARDMGSLSWYAIKGAFVPSGAQERITVEGADTAVLINDPGAVHSSVTALAAVGPVIYEVEADDTRGSDAALIATAIVNAAIGSS